MIRLLLSTAALAGIPIGLAAAYLLVQPAWPHSAPPTQSQPLGWAYGWDCCSMTDCAPMKAGEISETSGGYLVHRTGEVIPYGDKRLRRSKDELFHRCAKGGDFDAKTSLCLYTPDRGF